MLRDTPRLRGKVAERRARDNQNALRRKVLMVVSWRLVARTVSQSEWSPVRVVLLDDVDRYPATAVALKAIHCSGDRAPQRSGTERS